MLVLNGHLTDLIECKQFFAFIDFQDIQTESLLALLSPEPTRTSATPQSLLQLTNPREILIEPLLFSCDDSVLVHDLKVVAGRLDIEDDFEIVFLRVYEALLVERGYFGVGIVAPAFAKRELGVILFGDLHTGHLLVEHLYFILVLYDLLNALNFPLAYPEKLNENRNVDTL